MRSGILLLLLLLGSGPTAAQDRIAPARRPVDAPKPAEGQSVDLVKDPTIDITKDPAKDPTLDITKDPGKEPIVNPDITGKPIERPGAAPLPPERAEASGDVSDAPGAKTGSRKKSGADASGSEYSGPAILSRGFNYTRPSIIRRERISPFVGITSSYDSGLTTPVALSGRPDTRPGAGSMSVNFGVAGERAGRKDLVSVDYRGNIYRDFPNRGYGGSDHLLTLGYTRELTPHFQVSVHENGGVYKNSYNLFNAQNLNLQGNIDNTLGIGNLALNPNTEAFDVRTYYSTSMTDFVYRANSHLSFDGGIGYFVSKREFNNLASASGYQARGDIAYRVTRKTTVGTYYAFNHYSFSKAFGSADLHTVGVDYSYAFNKRSELNIRGGGSRVETLGLKTVTLDPFVASILGRTTGIETAYAVKYLPDAAVSLTQGFRRVTGTFLFGMGATPGNGLTLTSRRQSIGLVLDYRGFRRYTTSLSMGRDTLSSLSDQFGSYGSYYARANVGREIGHFVQTNLSLEYRDFSYGQSVGTFNAYANRGVRVSLSIRYSPALDLLRVW